MCSANVSQFPMTISHKIDREAVDSIPIIDNTFSKMEDNALDLEESESTMIQLWMRALPQDLAQYHIINKHSDFFHVGGNSLALINLQALIHEHLGVKVPIHKLFEHITLSQMSALLMNEENANSRLGRVDWDEEADVRALVERFQAAKHLPFPNKVPKEVILTGATGFLGKEVLNQLIDDSRVTKIHCVAVRKAKENLSSLFLHPKVAIYSGDLGAPILGLSAIDVSTIFSVSDALIHIGADVSFMKTYHSLKLVNVASTKELAQLCLPRRIPFHYISSAGVARLSGLGTFGPVSIQQYRPQPDNADGYTAAKWVNEVYLERASSQLGLPVIIHRPSSITGDGAPESDLMGSIMKYSKIIEAFPKGGFRGSYLDFISVQEAARIILANVMDHPVTSEENIRYVNESGEVVLNMNEISSVIVEGERHAFRTLPLVQWIADAVEAGLNPLLGTFLQKMANEHIILPRLER